MLEIHPNTNRISAGADGRWSIQAPAKLNLGLRIFPPRPDGFHDLESWMVPISWHDTLWVTPGGPLQLRITGRSEGIPTETDKNLVGRAALRLAQAGGIEAHGTIELHKVVPPGGGLGGGSSDAAHALVLLNDVWNLHIESPKLLHIAAELGSDVPFFVQGRSALCKGRGEIMTPICSYGPLYAVLLVPPMGLATKPVYQAFDAGHRPTKQLPTPWCSWATMPADELNEALVNDLEPAAFTLAPWLAELQTRAAATTGQKVHMTGSGSTLFTLCSSGSRASAMADRLNDELRDAAVCVPVRILRQR